MTHDKFAHEPECPTGKDWYEMCECETLRSAYQRGREDAAKAVETALNDYMYGEECGPPEFRLIAAARGDGAE